MPEERTASFISRYWPVISAIAIGTFSIGGLFTKIQLQEKEISNIRELYEKHLVDAQDQHKHLEEKELKKWGDIEEIEQRVDDLEEWKAYEDGYKDAKK